MKFRKGGVNDPSGYSNLFILVCNIPHEEAASAMEKQIIKGIKAEWASSHQDPNCEHLHIIYLSPEDDATSPKFRILNKITNRSKIYFLGHHNYQKDNDCLRSNKIYQDRNSNSPDLIDYPFKYTDLGLILLKNITDKSVLIDREDLSSLTPEEKQNLIERRRLKIFVAACHSSRKNKIQNGYVSESFTEKLANYINNYQGKFLLSDVVGTNLYLIPTGTKPTLKNYKNLFFNTIENLEPGFHKIYSPYENVPIPLHKNVLYDYKTMFIFDKSIKQELDSQPNTDHAIFSCEKLSVRQINERFKKQCQVESTIANNASSFQISQRN